ncbi:MAG: OprO/OprP family phosphate-selective porin [Planctomycetota bacterium]|jgi:phosphate-selective porin OprO/OprP
MKEGNIHVFGKLLLVAIVLVFGLCVPVTVRAGQDNSARIKNLEQQLKAVQDELADIKPKVGPTDFRVFWKEGLRFETPNKEFQMKFGGRIMHDWTWVGEDDDLKADPLIGNQEDGTEFRRVRFYTSGLIHGNVEFKLQFDFAGRDADLKDAYLGLKDFPLGNIRGGHLKEPFGLEELTSSKYITFMERSLPMEAFAPSRNTGLLLFDTAREDRMTWAVGIFRDTDDDGDVQDDGGYNFTGRLTTLPVYEDEGASLIHLGIGYSHRNPNGESARFRSRPGAHLLDRFVDTTSFASDTVDLLGLEGAWVSGPLSVQGEYVFASVDQAGSSSSSADFHGYYIQTSYFLTGEHRKYKPSAGSFSRVKPKENFSFGGGGSGAWEVGLRYSGLDLDDSGISGGKLDTITAGLNWHLNPNTRIMWNYIHADKDDVGNADMLLARLQIDF